jgi:uncharacterized membrane protein YhhN
MPSKFTFGYVIVSILILAAYLSENIIAQYATRPLLCLWLLFFYQVNISSQKYKQTNLAVYMALIGALIGDILFIEDHTEILGIGTLFYLLMYIGYIRAYQVQGTKMLFKDLNTFLKILPVIISIFICFGVLVLQEVQTPYLPISMLYTVIATIFGVISILRETDKISYAYGLIGAIVFIIASAMSAYQTFFQKDFSHIWIIILYCIGQYAVIMAISIHFHPKSSRKGKSFN